VVFSHDCARRQSYQTAEASADASEISWIRARSNKASLEVKPTAFA
jgi:hypothetical protein